MPVIEQILDLARWAPSGDNTQPWRFEIAAADHVIVHGFDTREHCVYDLDGRSSQLAVGAMLETLRIAATGHGLRVRVARRADAPESRPLFDVTLEADASVVPSALIPAITVRCVQRRAMQTRPIRPEEKAELEASLPAGYTAVWLEGGKRWSMARLLFTSARIRLTTREAFEVHSKIIRWQAQFSEDGIPDRAIGLDPLMTRVMEWAMRDWRRVWFLNTFLAGTLMPRLQLDLLPAMACGAHVLIVAATEPRGVDDYTKAGAAVQRFWLTATHLGLQHQPEMTPLIFARYVQDGRAFTQNRSASRTAAGVAGRLAGIVGDDTLRRGVWLGRLGGGRPARARSLRMPLQQLLTS